MCETCYYVTSYNCSTSIYEGGQNKTLCNCYDGGGSGSGLELVDRRFCIAALEFKRKKEKHVSCFLSVSFSKSLWIAVSFMALLCEAFFVYCGQYCWHI